MGFAPPLYPLLFSAWHNQVGPPPVGLPYAVGAVCQLALLPPAALGAIPPGGVGDVTHILRSPVGFDIRDNYTAQTLGQTPTDLIEVPQGSGNFYLVYLVTAAGLGFTNAHLRALLCRQQSHRLEPQPARIL
jgi:hypothetical protein